MSEVWFKKLGFGRNPFTIKPAAFSYELFGANVDGVISGIEEGKVLFVEAPLGHGKTTLLKSIVCRFGGRKKVIYAHAVPSQNIEVKELLKRSSLASFITGNLPNGMILVVDEAQNILEDSSAQIMEFYRSGNIKAVVFFGTRYTGDGFTGEIRAVMNGNMVRLSRPTPEQAVSLVRSRIGNLSLISNEVILMAYRKAQGNPRRLLQICEDMCRAAVEDGRLSVSPSKILDVSPFPAAEKPTVRKAERFVRRKPRIRSRRNPTRASTSRARLDSAQSLKSDLRHITPEASRRDSALFHEPAEAAPVSYVSSASGTAFGGSVGAEIIPAARKPDKSRKISKSAKVKKGRQVKQVKAGKKPKLPGPIAKPSEPVDVSDSTNESGHYWGEFMGMQK